MAGRIRHMERSRYSHRRAQQYGIYNQFHMNAYKVRSARDSKKTGQTIFQRLGSMLKKALSNKSS